MKDEQAQNFSVTCKPSSVCCEYFEKKKKKKTMMYPELKVCHSNVIQISTMDLYMGTLW